MDLEFILEIYSNTECAPLLTPRANAFYRYDSGCPGTCVTCRVHTPGRGDPYVLSYWAIPAIILERNSLCSQSQRWRPSHGEAGYAACTNLVILNFMFNPSQPLLPNHLRIAELHVHTRMHARSRSRTCGTRGKWWIWVDLGVRGRCLSIHRRLHCHVVISSVYIIHSLNFIRKFLYYSPFKLVFKQWLYS